MVKGLRAFSALFLLLSLTAAGQCPVPDFTVASSACSSENLFVTNLTAGTNNYHWDFCSGELSSAPAASVTITNSLLFRARSMRLANDDGAWTGFAIDQALNRLVRLDFGSDLSSVPTPVDLGNPGGALNGAFDFQLHDESGHWYALVVNSGNNTLVILDFGSSLQSSSPAVVNLGSLGVLNVPNGIELIANNGVVTGFVTNGGASTIVRLDFGSSVSNSPSVVTFPVPGAAGLRGIDIQRECDSWFGLAVSYDNGKVFWLDFTGGLQQPPGVGEIGFYTSYLFPASVSLALDGGNYYAFIQSALGSLYRLNFGASMLDKNGTGSDLGNLGISNENFALSMTRVGSTWHTFTIDLSQQRLMRLVFPQSCQPSLDSFTGAAPPAVTYGAAGNHNIALEVVSATGSVATVSKTVVVSSTVAPDIDFSILNSCRNHDIVFSSINLSGSITDYLWNFGDATSSALPNPTHQYASSGSKQIELRVQAANGCYNSQRKSLYVEDTPVSSFILPSASPICTFQLYDFQNTSVVDPISTPVWEWRVNGALVSNAKDLQTTFVGASTKEIRLKVIIPGCESESTQTVPTVLEGPVISFSASDDCAQSDVQFTNSTSGATAGYVWNFGDSTTPSTQVNPTHNYANPGVYAVSLMASNVAGCNNTIVQNITIYSLPEPNFSVGAPPFSCSNNPTLFQNLTAPLTDSNIAGWSWNFGDPSSNTSTAKEPSFTYSAGGVYSVSLTALSDAGCSQTTVLPITIGTSPVADFTHGPACINVPTQFADSSTGGVQSRFWQIGTSTFTTQSPAYTYTVPGNYTVSLTVTGTGGCTQSKSKQVIVAPIPALTLQVENPCVDQPAVFTLVESGLPLADAVTQWQWNIGGTLATGNPATAEVSLAGATPVSVITTHQSGCVYTKFENPVIFPSPVADFIAFPDRGDAPLTVQFENHSIGATSYQWLFSDRTPATSSVTSPVYTFLELGNYSAQLTALNTYGCADSKSIPIEVLVPAIDLQVTSFSLAPDAATGKLRPSLTILNGSNVPITTVEVALSLSDRANVSETIMVNLQPGASATKTLTTLVDPVQFTDPFVCVQVISEKDGFPGNNKSCINLSGEDYIFEPYPNPSSGTVRVDWVCEEAGMASVTIRNSQGRKEYYWETPTQPGLNQSVHDLSFLAAGIYFVTVQTANAAQTRRIVRQ